MQGFETVNALNHCCIFHNISFDIIEVGAFEAALIMLRMRLFTPKLCQQVADLGGDIVQSNAVNISSRATGFRELAVRGLCMWLRFLLLHQLIF